MCIIKKLQKKCIIDLFTIDKYIGNVLKSNYICMLNKSLHK